MPFVGSLVQTICNSVTGVGLSTANQTRVLEAELNLSLKQKEWTLQVQAIDWNMKLAKLKIEQGEYL